MAKHLTFREKEFIANCIENGIPVTVIADYFEMAHTSIWRFMKKEKIKSNKKTTTQIIQEHRKMKTDEFKKMIEEYEKHSQM